METTFVNDARVMAKGQVTIPKNVRAALGIETGVIYLFQLLYFQMAVPLLLPL